ncbi:G-type lectin S-receptor-like serine/threonine-protein kinase At5g35370 [Elaeis guineensis]|uniref:Receptor-like serine/threonine-protein kinase n=1 Tax=Elaeis guineensis var. tenera TaxID=51953 RepID=A0A6J0PRN0_ELAGV|nr:G-type lectin S-receptor-like serine/threonine-protein kinase At5g35370 [Elaeis guineensis]
MATPFLLLLLLLYPFTSSAAIVATEFLYPNFSATVINYVDNAGVFLTSPNATFKAAIYSPGQQPHHYYLTLFHGPTNTPVWSANRNSPIPDDGLVILSPVGLSVAQPNGSLLWSTPPLPSPLRALRLLDTGNLLLINASNATLWQSFDHPTDTLLSGQLLRAGSSLTSPVSNTDFSEGDYRLTVTTSDAVMTWKESQQYYSISTDARFFKDYNDDISFMVANSTGLYLLSTNQKVIFHMFLAASSFRIMKLDSAGRFQIISYSTANSSSSLNDRFVAPSSDCDLPFSCQTFGLCNSGANGTFCTCPDLFETSNTGGCSPADDSLLASTCGANSSISYLSPGSGIVYFASKFLMPITVGQDISACQSLCSGNCSCLAFIYKNSSGSCYIVEQQLGSVFYSKESETANSIIYVKILLSGSPEPISGESTSRHLILILLPSIAVFLLITFVIFMGLIWWMRQRPRKSGPRIRRSKSAVMKEIQLGRQKSKTVAAAGAKGRSSGDHESDDDNDNISILGLPTRFTYAELEAATWNFRTKIGSGGFGAVYKGELPDETLVAVKKIGNVGLQGKKEFCTEIAVIGNIHHVNLVRLRGFCAEGTKRLLVYEYMSRGSLDRSLFGIGPVLEWQERIDIAIGAARGLAYLHTGCEHKIIHCDVKPENILLDERGEARIGDFGLAKLLGPEQSGLFTTMRGTRGYLAPEWLTNSAISDRTDVYSFGMVLLELVRGRKNRSVEPSEGESGSAERSDSTGSGGGGGRYFPMVALEAHEQGRYRELADPRLEGRAAVGEVERVVKVALCCLHEEPGLRPAMGSVVAMLEGTAEVGEPRVESLNFLRVYGRGFAEPAGNACVFGRGGYDIGSVWGTATATSSGSPSYLSSQQLSGPR